MMPIGVRTVWTSGGTSEMPSASESYPQKSTAVASLLPPTSDESPITATPTPGGAVPARKRSNIDCALEPAFPPPPATTDVTRAFCTETLRNVVVVSDDEIATLLAANRRPTVTAEAGTPDSVVFSPRSDCRIVNEVAPARGATTTLPTSCPDRISVSFGTASNSRIGSSVGIDVMPSEDAAARAMAALSTDVGSTAVAAIAFKRSGESVACADVVVQYDSASLRSLTLKMVDGMVASRMSYPYTSLIGSCIVST